MGWNYSIYAEIKLIGQFYQVIYDKIVTKFEELTFHESVEDIEKYLKIELKTKNFEKEDLLNIFLEK